MIDRDRDRPNTVLGMPSWLFVVLFMVIQIAIWMGAFADNNDYTCPGGYYYSAHRDAADWVCPPTQRR